jgi:hypothetical protein
MFLYILPFLSSTIYTKLDELTLRLKACAAEIAEIMYTNTPASELSSLETIEKHIREQWLELVGPEVVFFLSNRQQEQNQDGLAQ